MKVLVTGATGFFGPGIVARLRQSGHEVIGCARRPSKGDRHCFIDVTDLGSCIQAFRAHAPIDAVVHAAALAHVKPVASLAARCDEVNVQGTRNVIQAARRTAVSRFVYISSVMVYGSFDLPDRVTEEFPVNPASMYAHAKLEAELAVLGSGIDAWVLRMATMYSHEWLFNIRKLVRVPIPGIDAYFRIEPSSRRYSLCSRDNGAEAALWAAEGRIPPGVYNVSDHHEYSQEEIQSAVAAVEGAHRQIRVPAALPRLARFVVRHACPFRTWRQNSESRYWRFCQRNVYPADKLGAYAVPAEPHLLALISPKETAT